MAYRHDIDGLRGLAIALVVVFHIWMGRVSGGVDVFLTLSGFFFLGSLLRGASDGRTALNPIPHLTRLVRRLYPALVVTVAATVVGTILIKPPTQWSAIFEQTLASLLYYQNWELALTSQDYAAADATISPLQHLWSMSVQGQFYLVALAVVLGLTAMWRLVGRGGCGDRRPHRHQGWGGGDEQRRPLLDRRVGDEHLPGRRADLEPADARPLDRVRRPARARRAR